MKKVFYCLLCTVFFLNICPTVNAYNFPNGFWALNEKYEQALTYKNYSGIIEYGNKIICMMENAYEAPEKTDILITRQREVGLAYAAIGDYESSARVFERLYDCAKDKDGYYDYARGAKAYAEQYRSYISMYTDKGTSPYFGEANEKKNGVLFGICANGATRSETKNESMVLLYQEFGHPLVAQNTYVIQKASEAGIAVEYALNCPNEGDDIRNIGNMDKSLKEISDVISYYPDVPVYLRFAAEFDIWMNMAEPDEFKAAFIYVSEYFRHRNPNVAIVWSPNQVSAWNVDIDDYYPGDEYVDWVGISLYAQRYFDGENKETGAFFFKTGDNSDPVIAIKDIVEKYGDRKPIMIAEGGCGHRIVTSGENTEDFALLRLREMYSYLPMIYPQIKLMAYFDWYIEGSGEKNDFRLSENETLKKNYLRLTKGSRFIQNSYSGESALCSRPVYNGIGLDGIFEVSCYAHMYGKSIENVTYFIDDNYVGISNEIPYTAYIDASEYAGRHTLKAVANFYGGESLSTQSDVLIYDTNSGISVEISGKRLEFDQNPVIFSDRTLVPLRKIFEALGATVSWDDETKTAIGKKGGKTVKVSVGRRAIEIDDSVVELDTAPIILSGRILVPVRAVAEGMGAEVDWNAEYRIVSITPMAFYQ